MKKIPSDLKKGDTIGIVAPAGFIPIEKIQSCIEILDSWGYSIKLGSTTHSQSNNYFSGSDEERISDLQEMLDDRNIKAILCARGGYGISRIIDRIDFDKFRKHPKWIIGYSDITLLHSHLYSNYKISSLHAPMASAFADGEINNPFIESIRFAIEGKKIHYKCLPHSYNKTGSTSGILIGGNLTLLTHMIGTSSDLNYKNKLLFIEDVGEYIYNVDRMFIQLKRSGKLEKLSGLLIGGFTEMKDTERPFGKKVYDILLEHLNEYEFPVAFGFPVSHTKENLTLKVGLDYELIVNEQSVELKEKLS